MNDIPPIIAVGIVDITDENLGMNESIIANTAAILITLGSYTLESSRNLIIAGVIFVCGLGFGGGLTFTIGGTSITLTALAIAAIAGILLNAILPGNDYEFGKNPAGDSSRGVYVMNTDSEKEESEDNK